MIFRVEICFDLYCSIKLGAELLVLNSKNCWFNVCEEIEFVGKASAAILENTDKRVFIKLRLGL